MNTLLRKELKKNKISLVGIFILFLIISLSLMSAISIYLNSSAYIQSQMNNLGFGDMTAWVNDNEDIEHITQEIKDMEEVEGVSTQPLIYAGYTIRDSHSDSEGQLIEYNPSQYDYRIINQNLNGYIEDIVIQPGEIYITPALHSMYDISIGDEITFDISRQGEPQSFVVSGYFEDPFMGSSMIDMKSFLICQSDFKQITQLIDDTSDFNKLARNGAMLHIFQNNSFTLSNTQFNQVINSETELGNVTEFVYSQSSIFGFMMILQNMFTGFLSAFVIILLIVSMIVIGYNISHSIDLEKKDIGVLKTIGYRSITIRMIQILKYLTSIVTAILFSVILSPFVKLIARQMVTSTGLLIPINIPYILIFIIFIFMILIIGLFIFLKTKKMNKISPVQTIQRNHISISKHQMKISMIHKRGLLSSIAFRQLLSDKRRYVGVFIISFVLVLFLSLVGRINTWIGPHGEGLMDAFSVASHDIGVQPLTQFDMTHVDELISRYATVEDTYQLAMQNVRIDGTDYTANIIDDPSLLHIITGQTANRDDEVVVTEYVANDLGIDIGDSIHVAYQNHNFDYRVVGIYQCANEMGANIAMNTQGFEKISSIQGNIWCKHYILSDHSQNEMIMQELQNRYPIDLAVHTNSWSGLDGIVETMHLLTLAMYGVISLFIVVTVFLIGSQILYFQQRNLSILKALGFQTYQLRLAFALKFTITVFIGALLSTILGIYISDPIISLLVQFFGIGEFHSSITLTNTILPISIITIIFALFAYISSYKLKRQALTTLIVE